MSVQTWTSADTAGNVYTTLTTPFTTNTFLWNGGTTTTTFSTTSTVTIFTAEQTPKPHVIQEMI